MHQRIAAAIADVLRLPLVAAIPKVSMTVLSHSMSAGVLADPMCGSGTFLIEAALMAANTAPGLFRQRWPFQSWPDFDQAAWANSVDAAKQAQQKWDGLLLGNDVHSGALGLAQRSANYSHCDVSLHRSLSCFCFCPCCNLTGDLHTLKWLYVPEGMAKHAVYARVF